MESQYTVEDNNDTKSLIEQYIKDHANDSKINTAQLGRLFNISKQSVVTISICIYTEYRQTGL